MNSVIERDLLGLTDRLWLYCLDHVYAELKKKTKDALLALIEKEREGEAIDRSLVKNVLGIFIEVGMGTMDCYQKDFEELKGQNGAPGGLLDETGAYYRRKVLAARPIKKAILAVLAVLLHDELLLFRLWVQLKKCGKPEFTFVDTWVPLYWACLKKIQLHKATCALGRIAMSCGLHLLCNIRFFASMLS